MLDVGTPKAGPPSSLPSRVTALKEMLKPPPSSGVLIQRGRIATTCDCIGCKEGAPARAKDDTVSDFFNSLSIRRGKTEVKKYDRESQTLVELTEEDYNQVAYPYPHFVYMDPGPVTFTAPDGKAFTVRQLAEAFAKAEAGYDSRYIFFEGFEWGKDPHSFLAYFGS
ncbi:hypothetical protein ACHAXT_012938 [Thalassiosira profunda]